jgi:hypothetical protein
MILKSPSGTVDVTSVGRVETTVARAWGNPSAKVNKAPPTIDSLTDHHLDQSLELSTSFILVDLESKQRHLTQRKTRVEPIAR